MLSVYYLLLRQKFKTFSAPSYLMAAPLILLTLSYGCSQKAQDEVQLEIKTVQPAESNGVYNLVGSTNLPDSSLIAVEAIRYLNSTEKTTGASLNSDANTNRSILARQIVEVKQGKWQAENLNLWQVAPDGSFQEVWQANQGQILFTPESDVTFIATFNPTSQWQKLDRQKSQQSTVKFQQIEGKLLRFTNEGEKYVQASQTLSISLPGEKTTPPRLQDLNGGWGNRYQLPPKPLNSTTTLARPGKTRQTNAPLSPSEFVR